MATTTLVRNKTLPDSSSKTDFHELIDTTTATTIGIVNADIAGGAAITDSKLAQITTASKVSGASLAALANIPTGAGVVPTKNGGTGRDFSETVQGCLPYFSAEGTISALAVGTNGQFLKTQGATTNPVWTGLTGSNITSLLGAWVSKSAETSYLAATDGFVTAGGSGSTMVGYSNSSNPPTTQRSGSSSSTTWFMFPVKKGDYWKVTEATTIYWIPLGT